MGIFRKKSSDTFYQMRNTFQSSQKQNNFTTSRWPKWAPSRWNFIYYWQYFFLSKKPIQFLKFFFIILWILLLLHIVGCRTSWDRFVHWVWSQRTMIWILKWSCLIFSKFSKKIMFVCCFVIPDPIWMLLFEAI